MLISSWKQNYFLFYLNNIYYLFILFDNHSFPSLPPSHAPSPVSHGVDLSPLPVCDCCVERQYFIEKGLG